MTFTLSESLQDRAVIELEKVRKNKYPHMTDARARSFAVDHIDLLLKMIDIPRRTFSEDQQRCHIVQMCKSADLCKETADDVADEYLAHLKAMA